LSPYPLLPTYLLRILPQGYCTRPCPLCFHFCPLRGPFSLLWPRFHPHQPLVRFGRCYSRFNPLLSRFPPPVLRSRVFCFHFSQSPFVGLCPPCLFSSASCAFQSAPICCPFAICLQAIPTHLKLAFAPVRFHSASVRVSSRLVYFGPPCTNFSWGIPPIPSHPLLVHFSPFCCRVTLHLVDCSLLCFRFRPPCICFSPPCAYSLGFECISIRISFMSIRSLFVSIRFELMLAALRTFPSALRFFQSASCPTSCNPSIPPIGCSGDYMSKLP
jgi:hypothetical protein